MSIDPDARSSFRTLALFTAIAALVGADLVSDSRAGTSAGHLAFELTVMGLALLGAGLLWREARRELVRLDEDLSAARAEAERWGLGRGGRAELAAFFLEDLLLPEKP
jgi:hypothetical protein